MICESCGKKEATIHFTKIEAGEMEEKHLCEDCAKEGDKMDFGVQFTLNDLFGGLLGFDIEEESAKNTKKDKVCNRCGLSYRRILNTGKFGCPDCFVNFREEIKPLLRSIHGHDEHKGKIPSNTNKRLTKKRQIKVLKQELEKSILEERYEESAKIRDEIKKIEDNMELNEKNIENKENVENKNEE